MLDAVSLDQLRAFIAAVDEGSSTAVGRKLCRVQSAVSGWISGLEAQFGVVLFDRTARFPKLTPEGEQLLADARNVVSGVDAMNARAKLMAGGLEAELSVVVDVFFPTATIGAAAKAFAEWFPLTPSRLFVEGLGAAYQPVLDERCSLGVLASLPVGFPSLVSEGVVEIPLAMGQDATTLRWKTRRAPICGSPKDLHSAFSNLVSNAVRYTPEGSAITIRWRRTPAGMGYSVTDTGYGIPAEHLSHLTERFYRVSSSRSRGSGGTGLGPSIVKHVLNLHDAELRIEREPGKGSTFTCVFGKARLLEPKRG